MARLYIVVTVALLSLLTACGRPQPDLSATSDVSYESANGIWLYYIEGDQLFRALCEPDQILLNKDTCPHLRRHTSVSDVYSPMKDQLETVLKAIEAEKIQWETKIRQIDLRILDLLSVPVFSDPAAAQALSVRIDHLQASVSETELALTEVRNQIALIRQQTDVTGDYVTMLNSLLVEQSRLDQRKAGLLAEISGLRNRWLALVTDIHDQVTFNLLQTQRRQSITNWDSAVSRYEEKIARLADVVRLFKYIADQSLTYDHVPSRGQRLTNPDLLADMVRLFEEKSAPSYTFPSHGRDSTFCQHGVICATTLVTVTAGTRPARIACRIETAAVSCQGIAVRSPGGVSDLIPLQQGVDASRVQDRASYARLFAAPVQGLWSFSTQCPVSGGGTPHARIFCEIGSAD